MARVNGVHWRFAAAVLTLYLPPTVGAAADRPNILIVVADDMGFSDVGCYGGEIHTPNLDRLAGNGLRFTQFYNTTRCWPSRSCLLSGYYPYQIRRDALPEMDGGAYGKRPAWARLLPELLHPLGYRSYHSGKWHIDGKMLTGGFDRSYCIEDYNRNFYPQDHTLDDKPLPAVKPDSGYYSTTAIAQYAIDMLAEHQTETRDRPFFMYLAFIAPHFPLQAPAEDIAIYKDRYIAGWDVVRQERCDRIGKMGLLDCALSKLEPSVVPSWNLNEETLQKQIGPGEAGRAVPWNELTNEQKQFQATKMSIHAAMIHRMDIEIGRVLDQLKAMDALDNTIVFFVSDNGASAEQMIRGDMHDRTAPPGSAKSFLCLGPGWSTAANTPFRMHKSWVHEGGIATPLIVHWPKGIAARGELRHDQGHLIDIVPTVLELAGGTWPETHNGKPVPPSPGKSLAPAFAKDDSLTRDDLFWYHLGNKAIRAGDWKLVAVAEGSWELYDLKADRSETKNLAADNPDKVKELEAAWTKRMIAFRDLANRDRPHASNE